MGLWVFVSAVAYGTVKTEDATGCLDASAVEFEVREIVGDDTVDQMNLLVRLSGEEHWQLALTVSSEAGTIWNRIVPVEPADCPYLAEFVAQSFERGLAEMPTWGLRGEIRPVELGVVLSGALPAPTRFITGIDAWIPVGSRFALQIQPNIAMTAAQAVNPVVGRDPAQVSYTSIQVEMGPGVELYWLRLSTRIGPGMGWATGDQFGAYSGRTIRPRLTSMTDAVIGPGRYIRFGARLEVPIVWARYTDSDGVLIDRELPVKVGLVTSISGPVRRSDGGRGERR